VLAAHLSAQPQRKQHPARLPAQLWKTYAKIP
jgi:hypothetical protein